MNNKCVDCKKESPLVMTTDEGTMYCFGCAYDAKRKREYAGMSKREVAMAEYRKAKERFVKEIPKVNSKVDAKNIHLQMMRLYYVIEKLECLLYTME